MRLTVAAWQMLQRLGQPHTCLLFCRDDGRFHFFIRDERSDLVRPSTIDALDKAGMLRRERFEIPSYIISDKGVSALRMRMRSADFDDDTCDAKPHSCYRDATHGL